MTILTEKRVETDILVIGGGGSGCFAAIKAHDSGAKVHIVNKVPWLGGCTMVARAGYSAAMGEQDSSDSVAGHVQDSLKAGDNMGNEKVLQAMCRGNVDATVDLLSWGAAFKKRPDGSCDLGDKPRPGHTSPRFVGVSGDYSHIGKTIMDALQPQIKQRGIPVISNVMITRLLVAEGEIAGAVGIDWRDGTFIIFNAKAVILATGGTGHLYQYTDNPIYITGDGYGAAYRAGAELVDMEFCDFQLGAYAPQELFGYPPNCAFWMSKGAILINRNGERFFKKYLPHRQHEAECLRTEISRAVAWEILDGHGSENGMIFLNCSDVPKDWMMTARADMVSHFKRVGIDLTWQPMEVAPGNHTYLGGVRINELAESTTIKGLYACGEASGGWGGSNRLGGNGVASALGLGVAAGKSAAERRVAAMPRIDENQVRQERRKLIDIVDYKGGISPLKVKSKIQKLMQEKAWLKRDEKGLKSLLDGLAKIEEHDLPKICLSGKRQTQRLLALRNALEAINLVDCGKIVAVSALTRTESRGSHQRSDYLNKDDDNWLKNVIVYQKGNELQVRTEPVVK